MLSWSFKVLAHLNKSAGKHVAPLWHSILILSQWICALVECLVTNNNLIVFWFDLTGAWTHDRSIILEGSMLTITPPMQFFWLIAAACLYYFCILGSHSYISIGEIRVNFKFWILKLLFWDFSISHSVTDIAKTYNILLEDFLFFKIIDNYTYDKK